MNVWVILKSLKKNYLAKKSYSLSTGKKISDKDYNHVLNVWNKFEMKTMKYQYDLHLKCDILLLADIFQKFKNNSFKNYDLCPSHYLSAPALSWYAMLNMTKVELELIPDPNMYKFLEHISKGGVSYISNWYSKANNNYFKSYEPKQESKHIIYLDMNNSYGCAMSKFLPTSGFKLLDPKACVCYFSLFKKKMFVFVILNKLHWKEI